MKKNNTKPAGEPIRCTVLTSPKMLPETVMKQKAKELARLERTIFHLILTLPNRLQTDEMIVTKSEKNKVFLHIPLFYQKEIYVSLYDERNANDSFNKKLSNLLNVNAAFSLSMDIFSDIETREAFEKLERSHPKQSYSAYVETMYFFGEEGQFAKTIEMPDEVGISRKPLDEIFEGQHVYQSTMTAEDFMYAERALTVMRDRIEDFLRFGRRNLVEDYEQVIRQVN